MSNGRFQRWRTAGVVLAASLAAQASAAGLTDPTRPAGSRPASVATHGTASRVLTVEAVLMRTGARFAIVNDVLVKVGDRVGGATIEAITPDGVRLSRGGRSELVRIARDRIEVRRPTVRLQLAAEGAR